MKKEKKADSVKPHPFDFSLKRSTKIEKSIPKPLCPGFMATALIKNHGLAKAKLMAERLSVSSFKDGQGNPVAVNQSASYWISVSRHLK